MSISEIIGRKLSGAVTDDNDVTISPTDTLPDKHIECFRRHASDTILHAVELALESGRKRDKALVRLGQSVPPARTLSQAVNIWGIHRHHLNRCDEQTLNEVAAAAAKELAERPESHVPKAIKVTVHRACGQLSVSFTAFRPTHQAAA